MESKLRIFWRSDCLCSPKRQHLPHIRHSRRRPPQAELLLDSPPADGHHSAAARRCGIRPHMEQVRTPSPLPAARSRSGHSGDVSAPQRRLVRTVARRCDDFRIHSPDVSRHQHQHGHAAVQDACGRHGQRKAERPRLLHTELPVQRRLTCRISRAYHPYSHRNKQSGSGRTGA